ncbi:fatty-acid--CoA ligase FadD1 [Rhodococcus sp. HNM0569]|uniref:fatty-acid--CoA ligase FadD1 n=1 Tax=Rhodococcus sp. HNM0569 TaxID=2716340 RepID=UPI003211E766
MVETLQQLLRERAHDTTVGLRHGDSSWTWREHVADASAVAAHLISLLDPQRPPHVGVLLGNSPDMARSLAAAALGGYVLCGLNTTRRGTALAADIARADCQLVVTDDEHRHLLDGLELGDVPVLVTSDAQWQALSGSEAPALAPLRESAPTDTFMLIFTSGTSGDPKAVQVNHMTVLVAGTVLTDRFALGPDDVCYVSMPLFHSNAVLAGWCVALASGAALVPARFSASHFLDDIRRYGATYMNYVGKPLAYVLATPEKTDDADNPLRVAFGNEAGDLDILDFGRRFGCTVWDGFGSTENAVIVTRVDGTPPGSIGQPFDGVAVYDPVTGVECPRAVFDRTGALVNHDDAVGELVNTYGAGMFAGYYRNPAATDERLRDGMYWSGDLAYRDADGFVYLAGRTGDWMRVDGENLTAAPIERILLRNHAVSQAAVYALPDPRAGDQVMAALVLVDDADLTPEDFARFLGEQPDLSPHAWPRYVRLAASLPSTATNKVLKRELVAQGTATSDPLWTRRGRSRVYA